MAEKNTTRYGLIGCGMMGQEHLRNIALLPGVEAAVIFDPDASSKRSSHELAPNAQMVTDIDAVLSAPGLDALVITSPNHCHAEQIAKIVAQRPIPILVEKPVCVSTQEATALKAVAAKASAPIWVGM